MHMNSTQPDCGCRPQADYYCTPEHRERFKLATQHQPRVTITPVGNRAQRRQHGQRNQRTSIFDMRRL